ncbi:MAG: GntR family transcriptional regulator [Clostridia bacterium]|nr:GntR family transcriptional regulator [Clostridia bacterium]
MSKRENTATLYLYVKEYIMKLLVSGKYPANSKLPTEYELMEELKVGRATVREALTRLETEGFIYKRQGIGTFVADNTEFSIHPFASFSYTANALGFTDTINVLNKDVFKVTDDNHNFLIHWNVGTEGKFVERTRIVEDTPVAFETVYILEIAYNFVGDDFAFKESLDEKSKNNIKSMVDRLSTDVYKRKPTEKEIEILKLTPNEDVVEIRRWIFATSISEKPIAFTNIVINSRMFKLQKGFRLSQL